MKLALNCFKFFICAIVLSSCATLDTVATAPSNSGISQDFSGDHELVKAATLASIQNLNVNVKQSKQTPEGFVILFTKSISAFSYGEVARALVSKVNANTSTVFVHSEKRYQIQLTGTEEDDFANSIFQGITEILAKKRK